MHRTSQMLVAQAMSSYILGNNWKIRVKNPTKSNFMALLGADRANALRSIISLFADDKPDSPLSLHNLVNHGVKYGKAPSEWFGPATTGNVLRDIFAVEQPAGFAFYAVEDGIVDESALISIATAPRVPEKAHWLIKRLEGANDGDINGKRETGIIKKAQKQKRKSDEKNDDDEESDDDDDYDSDSDDSDSEPSSAAKVALSDDGDDDDGDGDGRQVWRPTVVFIPLRLGREKCMSKSYIPSLTAMFKLPQSIGMIGGKPHSSLYFVAAQGDSLHYLDPHCVQDTTSTMYDDYPLDSWVLPNLRWINCQDIDSSLALGFLILSKYDFCNFKKTVKKIFKVLPPLFTFVKDGAKLTEKKVSADPAAAAANGDGPSTAGPSSFTVGAGDYDNDDDFEVIN